MNQYPCHPYFFGPKEGEELIACLAAGWVTGDVKTGDDQTTAESKL
jgi:hypothetical protein